MIYESLVKNTAAYKIAARDKAAGRLSHAYLVVCQDGLYLRRYLDLFAALLLCPANGCGTCRICSLVGREKYADMTVFPAEEGDKIKTEDIDFLVEDSYIKPFEGDKNLYVLAGAENMTPAAQNKLLKTLEEPPANVHILMGAVSEYGLLPTVKSRVRKLEIPAFPDEALLSAMEGDFPDREKLTAAVMNGDGTLGRAETLYGDQKLAEVTDLAVRIVTEMDSSADVLTFSGLVAKESLADLMSVLQLTYRDLIAAAEGREDLVQNKAVFARTKGALGRYPKGALYHASEAITEAYVRKNFNAQDNMLAEWLLFQILEGKYKWQRL